MPRKKDSNAPPQPRGRKPKNSTPIVGPAAASPFGGLFAGATFKADEISDKPFGGLFDERHATDALTGESAASPFADLFAVPAEKIKPAAVAEDTILSVSAEPFVFHKVEPPEDMPAHVKKLAELYNEEPFPISEKLEKILAENAMRVNGDGQEAHAVFSASSSEGWRNCFARIPMSFGRPNEPTPSSIEGTRAHELMEHCLKRKVTKVSQLPEEIFDKYKDNSMLAYMNQVLDYVHAKMFSMQTEHLESEARYHFGPFIGIRSQFGTGDGMIISGDETSMCSFDLKFGANQKNQVCAAKNPQCMSYLIGKLGQLMHTGQWSLLKKLQLFEVAILQPRLKHFDESIVTWHDVIQFITTSRIYVKQTLDVIERGVLKDDQMPGLETCKFCIATAICESRANKVASLVFKTESMAQAPFADPRPNTNDLKVLGDYLDHIPFIEVWIREVRKEGIRRLHAGDAPEGRYGPYHLEQGRDGNRKWLDEDATAEFLLKELKLTKAEISKPGLQTVAQIEALLKIKERAEDIPKLEKLIAPRKEGDYSVEDARSKGAHLKPPKQSLTVNDFTAAPVGASAVEATASNPFADLFG